MANTKVTTNVIADDAITGAKIADDAINSEHYTDGSIDTAHIADDQVTLAKMAGLARGKIIYGDSSGNPAALAVGSNGQVLKSDGTDISWGTDSSNDRDGAAVFNESGAAVDFRIEGDTEQNLFFVDGSADKIGIGTSSPASVLSVKSDVNNNVNNGILFEAADSTNKLLQLYENSTGECYMGFYQADTQTALIRTNGNSYFNGGNIGIGTTSPDYILEMEFAASNHTGGPAITNSQAGGYGSALNFQSERSDTNAHQIAARIRTEGADSWNTAASIDSNLKFDLISANTLNTRMTISHDGLVGIGTTSPSHPLHLSRSSDGSILKLEAQSVAAWEISVRNTSTLSGVGSGALEFIPKVGNAYFAVGLAGTTTPLIHVTNTGIHTIGGSGANPAYTFNDDKDIGMFRATADTLGFSTGGSERMRIDSSGNASVGKTSTGLTNTGITLYNNGGIDIVHSLTSTNETTVWNNNNDSGATYILDFRQDNSTAGSIDVASSSTSYTTSSDYRLKENVDYDWDATTRLKQLKPARFNWIKDDTNTLLDGFLAHEVSSIVPEAVSGEKDGERMQCIDHSKLVPLLVKTIQELEARIATLEG